MNNIKLYYINGISRENTPYFDGTSSQESYMNSHLVGAPTDGFYVPHYQDVIEFATSDVWFSRVINYLSITFGGKVYYYFIDSIEYISEDLVSISITLDTIQTFMFDIDIHESIIERKFIDRVIDGKINRNYLRENLSNGVWEEPVYDYITLSDGVGCFIAQSTQYKNNPSERIENINAFLFEGEPVFDTSIKYFAPFKDYDFDGSDIQVLKSTITGTTSYSTYNQYLALADMVGAVEVECIYYLPFMPFEYTLEKDTSFQPSLNAMLIEGCKVLVLNSAPASYFQIISGESTQSSATVDLKVTIGFRDWDTITLYSPSTNTGVAYSSSLITQMVDDNYKSVNFGERSYAASFPLYYTDNCEVYCKYTADISTGTRIYGITDDYKSYTFSKGGLVVAPSIYFPKINDTWLNWQAQNRATLPMAALNVAVQGMKSMLSFAGSQALSAAKNMNIQKEPTFPRVGRSRVLKVDAVNQQYRRYAAGNIRAAEDTANKMDLAGGIIGAGASFMGTAASAMNAYLAPDSVKQTSNHLTDYISGSCRNVYYELKVIDFEQVAYYYHRFGFLVNTPFRSEYSMGKLMPFLTTLMSRYYFDYYKFQYADIDLNYLCTADMVDDVIDRLTSGIRVWYTDHATMCDYSYDNVERSVL